MMITMTGKKNTTPIPVENARIPIYHSGNRKKMKRMEEVFLLLSL